MVEVRVVDSYSAGRINKTLEETGSKNIIYDSNLDGNIELSKVEIDTDKDWNDKDINNINNINGKNIHLNKSAEDVEITLNVDNSEYLSKIKLLEQSNFGHLIYYDGKNTGETSGKLVISGYSGGVEKQHLLFERKFNEIYSKSNISPLHDVGVSLGGSSRRFNNMYGANGYFNC